MSTTFESSRPLSGVQNQTKTGFAIDRVLALPDVLVQDPVRKRNYFLPKERLASFAVQPDGLDKIGIGTVTFLIPNGEPLLTVPPFNVSPDAAPSVLIQHAAGKKSYYLTFDQLQEFVIDYEPGRSGYGISFVIPTGMELIEELPPLMKAALQTGEVHPTI